MLILSNSVSRFTLSVISSGFDLQSMAELLAENYHNIWAKKKKLELEAKGEVVHENCALLDLIGSYLFLLGGAKKLMPKV